MQIGILEHDRALTHQLEAALSSAGYRCVIIQSGPGMIDWLAGEVLDLLLLDWDAPASSRGAVIEWAKRHLARRPLIFAITAPSAEEVMVAALNSGADSILFKPFQMPVLLARMAAIKRWMHPEQSADGIETHGAYVFDTKSETLTFNGEAIRLTTIEHALALMLFRNADRALSRGYLLETIWGLQADHSTRTLDAHISRIRTKLRLRGGNGFRLVSAYAHGYRLERTKGDFHGQ